MLGAENNKTIDAHITNMAIDILILDYYNFSPQFRTWWKSPEQTRVQEM